MSVSLSREQYNLRENIQWRNMRILFLLETFFSLINTYQVLFEMEPQTPPNAKFPILTKIIIRRQILVKFSNIM
jgi:hypothetical protein